MRITASSEGALLSVRVSPKASRNGIEGVRNNVLQVRVTAPPAEGLANRLLGEFLAKQLGVAKSSVEVVRGFKSREKVILLRGLDPALVEQRLLHLLEQAESDNP
ncbi:MAG: YggU family protein [Deltaproteobacteria bacterium]|nr:YggU family protein [Deltaproteobacteria bacterium]MBF0508312.1 YggU family protein [Deltaproteobacteria bacterium]MBF0524373.1 YggU family protein [Deltaproteobacteria bacterium]